ncbi:ZNHI3 protein, partial [Serilophus lunatus]|nr:ZNHI3 protein [Serilophus lunatus]
MRAAGPCGECGERGTGRYRCPRCGCAYCSVRCCRSHRGTCPPAGQSAGRQESGSTREGEREPPAAEPGPWNVRDILGEEDERDRVPLDRLELLGNSEELRALLLNPHLRQLLLTLDQAPDKSSLLRKLMQEPLFVEFADCCLGVVEPPEKENVIPE